jgi:hypothetical protein
MQQLQTSQTPPNQLARRYALQVNYLQQDCNDALVKIRVALRPADGVNLPPGSLIAPVEAITLLGPKHAAAAKASRAAGRKAAGAAAAGDKGADVFELDVDDIYWEQDVLLGGDGAGGFNMFELRGSTFELAAPSGSGPMSQVGAAAGSAVKSSCVCRPVFSRGAWQLP